MRRPSFRTHTLALGAALIGALAFAIGACGSGDQDPPRSTGPSTGAGVGGFGAAPAVGQCEGDEIQDCKVWIDENNCFVGQQQCSDGEWGPCVDPGDLDSIAFGGQSACPTNPCNPDCEQYAETPPAPLEATGTPPPAGGPIGGLPSSWQNECVIDQSTQGVDCTSTGYCNFDTHCDNTPPASGTGEYCVPFVGNESDPGAGDPNFTIPVICDPDNFQVCNRGADFPGGDVEITFYPATPANCGENTGVVPYDPNGCIINQPIARGECIDVTTCGAYFMGTTTVYINGTDTAPPASVPETDQNDSWSVYQPSTNCACSASSVSGSIGDVYMYISLDTSGSMDWAPPAGGLITPARNALTTFVSDPASWDLNVAYRTFGDIGPGEDCDTNVCDPDECDDPIEDFDLLSNMGHRNQVLNAISNSVTNAFTPHRDALQGALQWTAAHATNPLYAGDKHVVVYISDGGSPSGGPFYCTSTPSDVYNQAAAYTGPPWNIETYAVALPNASTTLLGNIATSGGTTLIDLTDTVMYPNTETAMASALQLVAGNLAPCNIPIPNGGSIDPNALVAEYWPAGVQASAIPLRDVTVGAVNCTAATDEFYLDDYGTPTTMVLCPDTCTAIQADATAEVHFLAGCLGGYVPWTSPAYDYTLDCSASSAPTGWLWEFLTYNATVPGDSEVIWEMRTSNTSPIPGATPWVEVARTPPDPASAQFGTSNEIVLADTLGPLTQAQYLELRITINPTSDGSQTPSVTDWDITGGCYANE